MRLGVDLSGVSEAPYPQHLISSSSDAFLGIFKHGNLKLERRIRREFSLNLFQRVGWGGGMVPTDFNVVDVSMCLGASSPVTPQCRPGSRGACGTSLSVLCITSARGLRKAVKDLANVIREGSRTHGQPDPTGRAGQSQAEYD